jgi:hypothetical protein
MSLQILQKPSSVKALPSNYLHMTDNAKPRANQLKRRIIFLFLLFHMTTGGDQALGQVSA